MLKRILLPVIAVLVIACAAAVYLFSVNSPDEIIEMTAITVDETSDVIAIRFTDADGKPVSGVMCNVCDETSCTMLTSDDEGYARFAGEFVPSKVQLLKVPEGFVLPADAEFPLEEGKENVIVLNKE